jgi:hypothetical protein
LNALELFMATLDKYVSPLRIESIAKKYTIGSDSYEHGDSLICILNSFIDESVIRRLGQDFYSNKIPVSIEVVYENLGSRSKNRVTITPHTEDMVSIVIDDKYHGIRTEINIPKKVTVSSS